MWEETTKVCEYQGGGSLGTDLEATLGTGYHAKLQIFLSPSKTWQGMVCEFSNDISHNEDIFELQSREVLHNLWSWRT